MLTQQEKEKMIQKGMSSKKNFHRVEMSDADQEIPVQDESFKLSSILETCN